MVIYVLTAGNAYSMIIEIEHKFEDEREMMRSYRLRDRKEQGGAI